MTSNRNSFNLLLYILYFFLILLLVIIPTILAFIEDGFEALLLPFTAMGIWLLLFGRLKISKFRIEGKQAFAVGGALLFPTLISITVNKLGLPPILTPVSIIVGLIVATILYFAIKPSNVSKNRTLATVIFLVGLGMTVIGGAIKPPDDAAGVIIVNGIPMLPISSLSLFIQIFGLGTSVAGLSGLIFGFDKKK